MKLLPNNIAVIERDSHITRWVEESGRLDHDWRFIQQFDHLIPSGGVVVDGGAYIGDHTEYYLNRVGLSGKVYAFEPNREAYQCLIHNCPEAVTYQNGLAMFADVATQNLNPENIGASYLTAGLPSNEPVLCFPLDSLELKRLDFFKLDVEGMELQALRGGEATIERCKPAILLEFNVGRLEQNGVGPGVIYALLKRWGYALAWKTANHDPNQWDSLYTKV